MKRVDKRLLPEPLKLQDSNARFMAILIVPWMSEFYEIYIFKSDIAKTSNSK